MAASAAKPRVIIADDHALVAAGLRGLIEPACEVIAVVGDGEALVEATLALRPDLVLADVSMPLCNGIEAVRRIRRVLPQMRALLLSMHADRMYVADALEAGAAGYVVKHAAADELRRAIEVVLRGGSYVSPQLRTQAPATAAKGAANRLTVRQRRVLQLVAEGRTVRQIATILNLAPKTVEFHKYRVMGVLGLRTSADLVQFAVRHGMVSDSDAGRV